jgi:hypothetical protein
VGLASKRIVNRVFEVNHPLKAACRPLMVFDIVPDRFDRRQLGAVGWQVDQMDVGSHQQGPCILNLRRL